MSTPGPTIAERYELGELLGRGGMSEVRAGRDLRLDRDVAVKLLTPGGVEAPQTRERFEAEARAAASLSHPNVVLVFDSGEHEGMPFLVMERLPGRTLADEMAAGPLPPERARRVAANVLAALDAAHAAGIVHRDVKPSNVLVCPDGSVKVSDFGIAKTASAMTLTDHGVLLGTPGYLAPERLNGEPATSRSDLYSVGVLLYEALTGRPPFEGDSPIAVMRAIGEGRPVPVLERRPDLPPTLARAIERAMDKEPAARFASAAEMAAALVDEQPETVVTTSVPASESHAAETEPLSLPEPRPGRRADKRVQLIGGVCALVLLTVVVAMVARPGDRPDAAPSAAVTTGPPQPLPSRPAALSPGRYRTATLRPSIDFTVDDGWSLAEPEAADVLFLKRSAPNHPAVELTFLSLKRVYLRDRTYQSAVDYVAPGAGEPAPANLLEWLQRHPRLRVSRPSDTRIGSVQAVRVDVEATTPYPSEVCVGPCVALFQLDSPPGGYRLMKLDQGETMRLYIASVEGATVVVSTVARSDAIGTVAPSVETVLKTVAFVR